MEELKKKYKSAQKALAAFKEALEEENTQIVRDAVIQRFVRQPADEIGWKTLQAYLKQAEGITANSPKSCFREALSVHLITQDEAELALEMTDDRNLTVHTYHEEIAKKFIKSFRFIIN